MEIELNESTHLKEQGIEIKVIFCYFHTIANPEYSTQKCQILWTLWYLGGSV